MLSNQHFYHRITRKLVVAFGTMFNNLRLVRYDNSTGLEIERINVPLMYASKEKFYQRYMAAPDEYNPVNVSLPRMAFEMNAITYDPLRQKSIFNSSMTEIAGTPNLKRVRMTPYNFDFSLYIFIRNTEDGLQLVEQILPYFTPDYTVTIDSIGENELKLDIPITFNSINYDDSHEGDPESTRSLVWTLNFTAKGFIFGPVANVKMITSSTANVQSNAFETDAIKEMVLVDGNGDYSVSELVYQGIDLENADARAFVVDWNTTSNTLSVHDTTGTFKANTEVIGAVTGSRWTASTLGDGSTSILKLTTTPDPATANTWEDTFGFIVNVE